MFEQGDLQVRAGAAVRRRTGGRRLLAALVLLVALELAGRVATAALEGRRELSFLPVAERMADLGRGARELLEAQDEGPIRLDPELGWVHAAGHRGALLSTNRDGLRGRRVYAPTAPPGVLRLAAFGGSRVCGCGVADADTWSSRGESLHDRLEVLNHGVGDYGVDQALLLYRRSGAELDPRVVLLGFAPADYARGVSRFGGFRGSPEPPLGKPRFDVAPDGALRLLPNPFPGPAALASLFAEPRFALEAAPGDWHFEPLEWRNPLYERSAAVRLASTAAAKAWRTHLRRDRLFRDHRMNPDAEAFAVLVATVRRFAAEVRADGREFLLSIFPSGDDVFTDRAPAYAPLLAALADEAVLDLAPALRADPALARRALETPGGDYSPAAHAVVARTVVETLEARGWLRTRGARQRADERA